MVIRKLAITGASLVVGVAGSLLGQQANAVEEIVVYGSPSSIGAEAEQAWLEAHLAQQSESLTQNLKALLDRNLKTVDGEKPAVVLAVNEQRTKG